MKKQLFLGSFSGTLQIIISTLLILITIPIFISKLGLQLYSIFSLLLLFNNVNVFINLGLNTSLVKFVAEQGKSIQSNYDITVSFILLLLILIPISSLTILFNDFILSTIFSIDKVFINPETITLFNFIVISNCILLLGQIFTAVLDAQQKVYLSNSALILYNISYWGSILFSLFNFPGFTSISYSILSSTVLYFIIILIFFRKTWGNLNVKNLRENFFRTAKKQLSYGFKLYISGSISFFYEPMTKILISHFIGLNEVAFFDIAVRVKNQIWNLISRIFYPIFPLISTIKDKNSIKNIIHIVEQKSSFLIIPLIISIVFVAKPFIEIWIGSNVKIISITMIFITSAFIGAVLFIPMYQYLMAKGHPEKTINIQLLNVFINSLIFFISLPLLGYYSAVASSTGAIICSSLLTLYYQKKYLGVLVFNDLDLLLKLFLLLTLNVFIGLVLSILISTNLFKILFIPIVLILTSFYAFRILKVFSKEEIEKFIGSKNIIAKTLEKFLIKI